MKLQNDDEEEYGSLSIKMPTIILAASAAIFVVLAIVLAANGVGSKKNNNKKTDTTETVVEEENNSSTLTAADLNFWDMYKDGTEAESSSGSNGNRKDAFEQRAEEMSRAEEEAALEAKKEAEENVDPAQDGKHTLIKHTDGSTEWIAINSSIGLNNFEDTQFQSKNGIIEYTLNGKKTSKTGVDISQYTTQIDWARLATEVDYVMIRVGARGYDSGNIIADTKFVENVKGAYDAGIPFGLYFSSQAITAQEAEVEANYCLTQLAYASQVISTQNAGTTTTTNNGTNTSNSTNNSSGNNSTNSSTNTTNNNGSTNNNTSTSTVNGVTTTVDASGNTITTYKDSEGNSVSKWVYPNGNSVTSITKPDGTVKSTTVITTDANGVTTTSVTDENGNTTQSTTTGGQANTANQNNTGSYIVDNNTNNTNNNTSTTNNTKVFKVSYPIAIDMHRVANDKSRIEKLTMNDRTTVLTAFCDAIKKAGYDSVICGTKEFLICDINLASISNYDKWVYNEGNLPDYPYNMTMWKYNSDGNLLKSMSGDYSLDVSFVDYSVR